MGITIETPDPEYESIHEVRIERDEKITDWFVFQGRPIDYIYDFGDGWAHKVELEKIVPKAKSLMYPRCIAGRRVCPPEDCGGDFGYAQLLEIINDPSHSEYEETMEWLGDEFDPEYFQPEDVVFDDPEEHWKFAYE